jgi:hypothetical protein
VKINDAVLLKQISSRRVRNNAVKIKKSPISGVETIGVFSDFTFNIYSKKRK